MRFGLEDRCDTPVHVLDRYNDLLGSEKAGCTSLAACGDLGLSYL